MSKNKISVTYAVTFSEAVKNGNRTYEAGKAYEFKTSAPSTHPSDLFDATYEAVHRLFKCIEKGSYTRFLPMAKEVEVLNCKEVEA